MRILEVTGMLGGTMECDDPEWNSKCEGRLLGYFLTLRYERIGREVD